MTLFDYADRARAAAPACDDTDETPWKAAPCGECGSEEICCGDDERAYCRAHCDCYGARKERGETRFDPDDCGLDGPDFDVPPEADGDTDDPAISPRARYAAYV